MVTSSFRPPPRLGSRRGWLVAYAGACTAAAALYVAVDSLAARTAISIAVLASGAVAVVAAILHRRRPEGLGYWLLVAVTASFWCVAWVVWQGFVALHAGAAPGLSSWRNFDFLGVYPLFAIVLLGLLRRREGRSIAVLETVIIAMGAMAIAWVALGRLYAYDHSLTPGTRAVQLAFLAGDIVVVAAVLRVLVSPGGRPPSLLFLLAGVLCLVYSDFIWNATTRLDSYTPGTWADLGWVMMGAFLGLAALHPSMRDLYAQSESSGAQVSRGGQILLAAASIIVPATIVAVAVGGYERSSVVVVALIGGALTLLILLRLLLVARDEARLAVALATQNTRLLELDRMKEDFVASVSHELRTPLTSIRGYLEIVQSGQVGELNDEQARFLAIVERNAQRLLRVVGDLLFAAQVGAGKIDLILEAVDLEEICSEAAAAAKPHVESKGIELVETIDPLPPVRADPARLGQVVDNLLSNAIKFTDAGGRIELAAFSENGSAVVEVKDSGQGMSPEEQSQLFQRFYRTESAVEQAIQGTGLGLAIVKAIVEAHGGSIGLTSAKGVGTTFRIELPSGPAPA